MPPAAFLALKPSSWLGAAPPAALEQSLAPSSLCLFDPQGSSLVGTQPVTVFRPRGPQRLLVSLQPGEVLDPAPWDPFRGAVFTWLPAALCFFKGDFLIETCKTSVPRASLAGRSCARVGRMGQRSPKLPVVWSHLASLQPV